MWELDHKESWALRNSCFWTVVLKKTLEIPLDCKEIKPVYPKGNHSWLFVVRKYFGHLIWRTDSLIQEEKGTTEDEVVGWHHWLDRHEFEQALGVGDTQGSLASCSPLGWKESDTTEQLNWTEWCVDKYTPLMEGVGSGSLICSTSWLPWCQYSHCGLFQTTTVTSLSTGLERDGVHQEPREGLQHISWLRHSNHQMCPDVFFFFFCLW